MHTAPLAALAGLLLSLGLPAQTEVVLPAAFATKMGSTANRIPHARQLTKYQQVFLGSEIAGGGSFVLQSLSLREDEQFVGAAATYDYTIRIGPTDKDGSNLTTNFAANFSGPATTVFSGSFNLPASGGAGGVNSWLFDLPFTTDYVHQAGDNLLIEWTNNSTTSSASFLDFCLSEPGCTTGQCFAFDPNATTATSVFADRGLIMRFKGHPPTLPTWPGDDFDSYAASQVLDDVGGWFGWDDLSAAAATVDGTRSRSAPNSLLVGATTDAVHPQIGATSGKWTLRAWQYIPTGGLAGGDAYFILNNVYNHGGPYTWTTELKASGTTVQDDLRTGTPQPLVFDQWVEYRADIDLDADTVSYYYNGGLVSTGVYTINGGPAAIENIDLFSTGATCNWDDVSLEWRGDAFDTYAAATVLDDVGGWFGWDDTPAAAATVDNARKLSAPNSLLVGATTDAVHPDIGITSGKWSLTAWQRIASGALAGGDVFIILNNVYSHGGPYTWTVQLKASGTTVQDDLRAGTPQPLVFDQWVEYRFDIDLDADTITSYYNGAQVSTGVYTINGGPAAIENIDLFSTGGTSHWDDLCFQRCGAFSNYGSGLAGSGGLVPTIGGGGCPTPGRVINVQINDALGGAPGCLFFGIMPANLPVLGGTLLVNPLTCLAYTLDGSGNGNGSKTFSFGVPDKSNYVGTDFYFQSVHADAGAAQGISFTDGLKMTPDR